MRSIDADALKDYFQSLAYDDWNQGVTTSWADAYRECADIVENTPTITPERKRGRWIEASAEEAFYYICSECGRRHDFEDPFCPNCGAKMQEDET